jgi:hypothetical protein
MVMFFIPFVCFWWRESPIWSYSVWCESQTSIDTCCICKFWHKRWFQTQWNMMLDRDVQEHKDIYVSLQPPWILVDGYEVCCGMNWFYRENDVNEAGGCNDKFCCLESNQATRLVTMMLMRGPGNHCELDRKWMKEFVHLLECTLGQRRSLFAGNLHDCISVLWNIWISLFSVTWSYRQQHAPFHCFLMVCTWCNCH